MMGNNNSQLKDLKVKKNFDKKKLKVQNVQAGSFSLPEAKQAGPLE